MEGFAVEFLKENILLIVLAVSSGVMLLLPGLKRNTGGVANLSALEAVNLINRNNALVLDVREATEFSGGHIVDAKHIPLAALPERINELKKYKDKAILVNCQRGMRGAKACEILRKAKFTQVHHLQGGIEAWVAAKLPVVKD